jgi:hypothetical protein
MLSKRVKQSSAGIDLEGSVRAVDLQGHIDRQAGSDVADELTASTAALATNGSAAAPAAPPVNARLLKPTRALFPSIQSFRLPPFSGRRTPALSGPIIEIEMAKSILRPSRRQIPSLVLRAANAP